MKSRKQEWPNLVIKARLGDVEAFESLVQFFQGMAMGFAYSILRNFEQSEDAVQSAFVDAYQNIRQVHDPLAFPAWFRKVVFKHCDRLKRGKRVPTISLDKVVETPSPDSCPHEQAVQQQLKDLVFKAIDALPENERTAISMFYIAGHSQSEVARFLEIPVSTLKNWLNRARHLLRDELLIGFGEAMLSTALNENLGKAIKAKIDGMRWVHRWLTHLGCLEGCLAHLGRSITPAWLSGGSGYAFAMRIHEELCPAGIIAWAPPPSLMHNVGLKTELLAPQTDDVAEQQRIVWSKTNRYLDQGQPCIGFAMEAWQSYIIHGYDDEGYFYLPVHTGDGHFSKAKMGVDVPCVMTFIETTQPATDEKTVLEALKFAVQYATDPDSVAPGWGGEAHEFVAGLAGYDLWIKSIESGKAENHGMSFNAQVFAELRRLAVDFLKEASLRIRKQDDFAKAIASYETVAHFLTKLADLFPLPAPPNQLKDPDRRKLACELIEQARAAEEEGVKQLQALINRGGKRE